MMIEITIETATTVDAAGICALDYQVTGSAGRVSYLRTALAAGHCTMARAGTDLLGFAVLAPSFFQRPFVELLIVHHGYRRRGIGTRLLRHCEAICPAPDLFTSTNRSNLAMQRLLEAAGYAGCGYVEHLDEGDPELIYWKRLGGP